MNTTTATSPVIRIHAADNVVIARRQLLSGTVLVEEGVAVAGLIPPGHKVAVRAIAAGEPVRRYNQIIGTATQPIAPGQHVHVHNLAFSSFERAHEFCAGATPTAYVAEPATFMGIVRHDGRVATRNYIGVLTSVNCSATAARAIADQFRRDIRPQALAAFPNVDGVVALTHGMGCATASDGEELLVLRRTLGGYAPCSSWVWAARPTRSRAWWRRKAWPKVRCSRPSTSRTPAAPPRPWRVVSSS
jgi:altronate hydrolase